MTFDWSNYRGNLTWLQKQTILMVRHGSHAYGLNVATSDEDFKGVTVAPGNYYHGFLDNFEQAESNTNQKKKKHNPIEQVQQVKDPDFVVYDVRKFMRLAADANPSILEVLFIDDENLLTVTPAGQLLRDVREQFLSRKVRHTYSGYAIQQLRRIQRHREWWVNPPGPPKTRKEMGLPEHTVIPKDQLAAAQSMIRDKLNSWVIDNLDALDDATKIAVQNKMVDILTDMKIMADETLASRSLGFSDNFIHLLDLERRYKASQTHYRDYLNWKATRNPARAILEEKYGFDTKHGMHMARLLMDAIDILQTGQHNVRSRHRDFLLGIRNGDMDYDTLVDFAKTKDAQLQEIAARSPLPNAPDRVKLSQLCERIVESMI